LSTLHTICGRVDETSSVETCRALVQVAVGRSVAAAGEHFEHSI